MDNLQINGFKSALEDGQLNYRNVPEKRTESLLRRIKRIQWKQLEKHTTEQLEAFYLRQKSLIHKNCQNVTKQEPNSQIDKSNKFSNCSISQSCQQESQETQTEPLPLSPKFSSQLSLSVRQTTQSSSVQTGSSLPSKFPSASSTLQASSKNGEKINLMPSEVIKPPVIMVDKQQQFSGLPSTDTDPNLTGFETAMTRERTSNKLTFSDEVTLQSIPDEQLTMNSIADHSLSNLQSEDNPIVSCSTFAPSLLDCPEDELLRSAVGILTANLKHFEYSYDSDATESSSGGESCDEFENVFTDNFSKFDSSSDPFVTIQRKANWRWLNERSAIASRWTWLQAQVADLEFKIRQQNEMYRQLRASKGSIAFYCKETPTNSSVLPNLTNENVCNNNSLGNGSNGPSKNQTNAPTNNGINECSLPSVNSDSTISLSPPATAAKTSPPAQSSQQPPNPTSPCTLSSTSTSITSTPKQPSIKDSTTATEDNNSEKEIHHCARTLPLKQMRKRKLVRSCNAITIASRKIARYSTIQCTCTNYPKFVSPCVLCNGRFSHLQMIDTDCMPNYERYALLDPSYHPVLSLPNDVALGLYFSKILKKETVQKPLISSTAKTNNKNRSNHTAEFSFKFGPDNKKINRRKSQAVISSTKLKKKYDGTTKKKYAKGNSNLRKRSLREKNDQANGSGDDGRTESPSPSPLSSENSHVPIHRRRRSEQYAYDINNIVIPYSIASTTRVEKLQYKEIITPKWRCVEVNNNNNNNNNDDNNDNNNVNNISNTNNVCHNNSFHFDEVGEETDEDISDETFAVRHLKCEIDERKQFSSYLKNPGGSGPGRSRGARTRLDSMRSDGGKNTLNNNGKNSNSKSNPTNSKNTGVSVNSNSNMNDSVQNIDISSQDSIVTAPINLNMSSNDDSLLSSTSTTTCATITPTTTIPPALTATSVTSTASTLPIASSALTTLTTPSIPTASTTSTISITAITNTTTTTTSSSSGKLVSKTVSISAPPTPNSNIIMDSVSDQETIHGSLAKTSNRNRTSSSSKCEDFVDDDTFVEVHPYDKRNFPISDLEYEEMLRISMESIREDETTLEAEANDETSKDGPKERESKRTCHLSQNSDDFVSIDGDTSSRSKSGKVSRCSSSASSSFVANGVDSEDDEDEDATDPEWEPCKTTKEL